MIAQADPTMTDMHSERRGGRRRRVLKHVQALALDKKSASAIDCTLRNMSSSGAQLHGPATAISRIPNPFNLVVPGQLRMIRCKVVWKTCDAVGIRFLSDPGHLASNVANSMIHAPAGTAERAPSPPSPTGPGQTVYRNDVPSSGLAGIVRDVERIVANSSRHSHNVPIELLRPSSTGVRRAFQPQDLQDLARSIRKSGLLQPLIVRRRGEEDYEIVAGERRWRAAQLAQLRKVPALICDVSDAEALEIALVENVQRADLNPLEEAHGYAQLTERFGYSQQQLADVLGKSRSHVANMLRLLALPHEVKAHIECGKLSAGHARVLVSRDAPIELADRIIAQGLSVRETERLANVRQGSRARTANGRREQPGWLGDLERTVSEALGLKVEISAPGPSKGRIVVHVQTPEQLNEVCRRLARRNC